MPDDDSDKTTNRSLPSWMSSEEMENKSCRKKQDDACKEATDHDVQSRNAISNETNKKTLPFSKLLEGVVFVLSGFVNPERSTLRSQALEMGAKYRPDWSSDCTLLVCAFPNTPKFRQVESDCGTISSKEWISECYRQKKLIDIDLYLMHAGRPWRKNNKHNEAHQGIRDHTDDRDVQPGQPRKEVERRAHPKLIGSAVPKVGLSNTVKDHFSPSKVQEWAIDDLSKTISWLESQEEKPEPDEIKTIAKEGIITCLQDTTESLRQGHDIRHVTEQWMFVPRVVKELAELEGKSKKGSLSKEELCELAMTCKKIYESKLDNLDSFSIKRKKKKTDCETEVSKETQVMSEDAGFDSDETIEMTEEEIELACKELSSEHGEWYGKE